MKYLTLCLDLAMVKLFCEGGCVRILKDSILAVLVEMILYVCA